MGSGKGVVLIFELAKGVVVEGLAAYVPKLERGYPANIATEGTRPPIF